VPHNAWPEDACEQINSPWESGRPLGGDELPAARLSGGGAPAGNRTRCTVLIKDQAIIRVTTYRVPKGSYVVAGATEFCVTQNSLNDGGAA
jgi:hypothetical protein